MTEPPPPSPQGGFLSRLRLPALLSRYPERPVRALFVLINGFITIAILGGVAMVSKTPFVFPSLGPTAFLLFATPLLPAASPRNTVLGHAIGIACGYLSLLMTGLADAPPAMVAGVHWDRLIAAALSLAFTGAFMMLLDCPHPPAGATTLIVSLGIVTRPFHLAIIEVAVALLVLQAIAINRLAGTPYPFWGSSKKDKPPRRSEARGSPPTP
jgi:CBS-domain-containing membrane protein